MRRPATEVDYGQLHAWLRKTYAKTGVCDHCGTGERRTEFALIHGHEYSWERIDYMELCKACHNGYDKPRLVRVPDEVRREIQRRYRKGRSGGASGVLGNVSQPDSARSLAVEFGIDRRAVVRIAKEVI